MQYLLHDSTLYVSFSLAKVMWTWFLKINSLRHKMDTNYQRRESSVEKTLTKFINSVRSVNLKGNQPWILIGRTDAEAKAEALATWCEEPTHWKRPWCWETLRAGGEGGHRGPDGWMASLILEHKFGQTPGDSGGQGSMVCCNPGVTNWRLKNNKE